VCAAALIRGIGDADLFRYNVRPIAESLGDPLEISNDKPEFLRERGRPFAISFHREKVEPIWTSQLRRQDFARFVSMLLTGDKPSY
jgi:hypothetical protein